jgi:flagellar biosynthetic protein FliR
MGTLVSSGPWPQEAIVAAGVCARIAAAVVAGTLPVLPGASVAIRLALALALAVVAVPMAWAVQQGTGGISVGPLLPVLVGEAFVGLAMGTAAAAVLVATAWAGGILGSVSGLSWADDFDPGAEGQSAGIARLAWWVGLAAFFAAGGQLAVVAGLVDSVRHVPVGTALSGPATDWLTTLGVATPAVAFSLAAMLAMPALVAVIAFHLASAICLRTIPFSPGPGVLQGLAAVVLLASLWLGAESWASGGAAVMLQSVDACFGGR